MNDGWMISFKQSCSFFKRCQKVLPAVVVVGTSVVPIKSGNWCQVHRIIHLNCVVGLLQLATTVRPDLLYHLTLCCVHFLIVLKYSCECLNLKCKKELKFGVIFSNCNELFYPFSHLHLNLQLKIIGLSFQVYLYGSCQHFYRPSPMDHLPTTHTITIHNNKTM